MGLPEDNFNVRIVLNMMRKILALVLLLTFFLPSVSILAQGMAEGDATPAIEIAYEKVNPKDGGSYAVKRLKEKAMLALLSFSKQRKTDYYNKLVGSRLAELKYVVDKKDMASFENATTRYFATVGQFVNFLVSKNLTEEKIKARQVLTSHVPLLESLRDTYDPTTAEWRFMQDDVNYVQTYINQLQ